MLVTIGKNCYIRRLQKRGCPNEEYRGCHYCSICDEYISVVAIYNYYISKINCKNEIHTIITKYINYGIHQLRIIYALLKYKLHKVGVSIISEAACQYHHISKTPSQGLQDLPRRRASMATPP